MYWLFEPNRSAQDTLKSVVQEKRCPSASTGRQLRVVQQKMEHRYQGRQLGAPIPKTSNTSLLMSPRVPDGWAVGHERRTSGKGTRKFPRKLGCLAIMGSA